jgi:ribosomal protein S18 acetylase RimI-like enzyme
MLLIRNFKKEDLDQVNSLISNEFARNYNTDFYLSIASRWKDGFLVAQDKIGIIGMCASVISAPKTARILLMVVRPDYRRRGIGAQLLSELVNRCYQLDLKAVTLEVRISNKDGIRFYQKHGFVTKTIISNYYEDGEAGYLMRKVL